MLKAIRKYAFWGQDSLNGGPIKKHYDDIRFINDNYGSHRSKELRKQYLQNVVSHALNTVPYYKKEVSGATFSDFPVINKTKVLENYEAFKSSSFLHSKNVQVSTNGSTGTPFKLFHNKNKRNRHKADNLFFAEKGGYRLGDRLYLLRALHKNDSKALLRFFKQNFKAYGVLNYSNEDLERLLDDFKKGNPNKCVVCFASMCEVIVNYIESQQIDAFDGGVKSIITDGDALSMGTKDKMEQFFGIPVYARYGNMECGVMAQQGPPNGYHYNLNWASYHFELLDIYEDKPAETGAMGRIVVTDLFNHCMPLIRYDTGDLARFASEDMPSDKPPVFDRIEGRVIDIIWDTSGNIVSPYLIYTITEKYNELKQFQFAQKASKKYVYRLNPWNEFTRESELLKESKSYLGKDADIAIEYVDEVPLLASKKRKPVVNEMN